MNKIYLIDLLEKLYEIPMDYFHKPIIVSCSPACTS